MRIQEAVFWAEEPAELLGFYRDGLRFPVLSESEEEWTVQAGATKLRFKRWEPGNQSERTPSAQEGDVDRTASARTGANTVMSTSTNGAGAPYYHLAFNIPENKLEEAKRWIETVVELGTEGGKDISRSEAWNSDSVYFMDPGGNILELIARHTMENAIDRPFVPERDIEGLSEIGLPTKRVTEAVDQLEKLGIFSYQGRSDSFNPVGDEEGMFIVVQPGRRWHFSRLTAECYPFEAVVEGIGWLCLSEGEQGLRIEIV